MELRATHAQPIDARFYSTQPLLGDAVERLSLGRNRGMGAGCRREAYCAGPIAGHVGREQLRRQGGRTSSPARWVEKLSGFPSHDPVGDCRNIAISTTTGSLVVAQFRN